MSTRYEEYKARILEVNDKNMLQEVDGFYYYFPTEDGFLTADGLRIIADELDRRNRDWQNQIDEILSVPVTIEPH